MPARLGRLQISGLCWYRPCGQANPDAITVVRRPAGHSKSDTTGHESRDAVTSVLRGRPQRIVGAGVQNRIQISLRRRGMDAGYRSPVETVRAAVPTAVGLREEVRSPTVRLQQWEYHDS